MHLFADGDGFWTMKTVIDLISVVGLFLTLFSIWFSWWLAKRDLSRRMAEAKESALQLVERIGTAWIEEGLSDLLRCVREVREGARAREWTRAVVRVDDAEHFLVRVLTSSRLRDAERTFLIRVADDLRILARTVQSYQASGQVRTLSKPKQDQLDNIIRGIGLIAGRLRSRVVEDTDVPDGGGALEPPTQADRGGPN